MVQLPGDIWHARERNKIHLLEGFPDLSARYGALRQAGMVSPSPRLPYGSPDVGSSPGRAGIAGELIVFKGTSNPVLGDAIG
jgi:hypothetical protein